MSGGRASTVDSAMVVQILGRHGEICGQFDFSQLQIDHRIADAFRVSYIAIHGKNSVETRKQAWRCLKRFCFFLTSKDLGRVNRLPSDILKNYRGWLLSQKLTNSTRQSQLNIVIALLTYIDRNASAVLEPDFGIRVSGFSRNEPKTLPALNAQTVKSILAAAYKEIDAAVLRLNATQELLETNGLELIS